MSTLARLEELTSMVFDAELAVLRARSGEVAALKAALARLGEARAARAAALHALPDGTDPALLAGQDGRWQGWLAAETARLSEEAAQAAARREEQRLKTQRAFGRVDALRQLREREAEERRVRAARRAYYG